MRRNWTDKAAQTRRMAFSKSILTDLLWLPAIYFSVDYGKTVFNAMQVKEAGDFLKQNIPHTEYTDGQLLFRDPWI